MTSNPSRHIEINGTRLWHEVTGDGPPLVLVHAGICDARMWDPQVATLSIDHRVVRYDLRGYGQSSIPPEPFAHHDDLAGLFAALGIERAVVVGASYGGNVAAAFTLEHPDRVRALVLVNSLVGMERPSDGLRAGWDAVNTAMDAGDVARAIAIETEMWVDGPLRAPEDVDRDLRESVTAMNAAIFARADEVDAAEERGIEPEARERLGEIRVPTLVVTGALDQPDALASAGTLIAGIPNARGVTIPDAAHLPSMERPGAFNRIVRGFLAEMAPDTEEESE
jgi:pimeloyl-ACP methyl ester carboxylesterase